MAKDKENKVLSRFLDLEDKELALLVINYYKNITGIKKDMVGSLNLLDKVVKGDKQSKELLRKNILDNYNELPRESLKFLEELLEKLKE